MDRIFRTQQGMCRTRISPAAREKKAARLRSPTIPCGSLERCHVISIKKEAKKKTVK